MRAPSFFTPPEPEKVVVKEPEKPAPRRRIGGGGWKTVRARVAEMAPPAAPEPPKEELPLLT